MDAVSRVGVTNRTQGTGVAPTPWPGRSLLGGGRQRERLVAQRCGRATGPITPRCSGPELAELAPAAERAR